jgi:predicted PolB exonuclease-like 3'-5' exonuclease
MIQELRDILFVDIETVANAPSLSAVNERMKVQWSRKASFLKRDATQTDDLLYEQRAGIYAEFGKIVCIAVGKFYDTETGTLGLRSKAYFGHDEKVVLGDFHSLITRLDPANLRLCAHNGKEFDYPYLCRRMLVNEFEIPEALNLTGRKPWEVQHYDTLEMWKFGDYKHYTSLDLLTALFDIPTSKTDMDGSQVNNVYYQDKDLNKIKDYCVRDVIALAQLFLKLKAIKLPQPIDVVVA